MAIKTIPTKKSVKIFLEKSKQKEDSLKLLKIFEEITKEKAVLWGNSIVGFGQYHYKYPSGQEGDWMITGFSPRSQNLTVYIMNGFKEYEKDLEKLGKHKHSVSCLYIKKLSDVDEKILKKIIRDSYKKMKKKYGN